MNAIIAEYYREKIGAFPWMELSAGLVRPVTTTKSNGDSSIVKIFPVGCDTSWQDCTGNTEKYRALVPDSSKRSISYFEDRGMGMTQDEGRKEYYVSYLRLVVWINLTKYQFNDCSMAHLAMVQMLDALKGNGKPGEFAGFNSIRFRSISSPPKDHNIFSAYTYDLQKPFLMYPYDFFALDIETMFRVDASCLADIETLEDACT